MIFNTKSTLMMAFVCAVAIAVLSSEASAESPHDVDKALRMLQELDRYYSQASRPRSYERATRGGATDTGDGGREDNSGVDPFKLDRAVKLLQLQTLDKFYTYHNRPRFGKRSKGIGKFTKEFENPSDNDDIVYYITRR